MYFKHANPVALAHMMAMLAYDASRPAGLGELHHRPGPMPSSAIKALDDDLAVRKIAQAASLALKVKA